MAICGRSLVGNRLKLKKSKDQELDLVLSLTLTGLTEKYSASQHPADTSLS